MSLESALKWALLAGGWTDAGPPAAPSPQDVSNYCLHLPALCHTVLVLGCTPSLRARLLSDGHSVLAVDISPEMIAATSSLVDLNGNQAVVLGNWLNMPLAAGSVDAVLGDKVLGNVMPEDWPQLFAELSRVLRPDGSFLTRATPHGGDSLQPPPKRDFRDIVVKWATLYDSGLAIENASSGLWEDCMDMSTENFARSIGSQQLSRVIPATEAECLAAAGRHLAATHLVGEFLARYWTSRFARWSAYTRNSILEAANPDFQYLTAYEASDYPAADRQPVLHFLRRSSY